MNRLRPVVAYSRDFLRFWWRELASALAVVGLILAFMALDGCASPTATRPAAVERLDHLADQVQGASLSAASLSAAAESARVEADQMDTLAADLFRDGRKGEAEERRVAAKVARLRAQDLAAQAAQQAAIATAGRTLLAEGRDEIERENKKAREAAHQEAQRANIDHLVWLGTLIGGCAFLGGLGLLVVARLWPVVGAFVDWHAPAAIGAGGLAMCVGSQVLGAAMPHLIQGTLIGGCVGFVGFVGWLVVAIARRGHAGTAAGAGFADQVIDLVHDLRGRLSESESADAVAKLDQLKQAAMESQEAAKIRGVVQVVRGKPIKPPLVLP